MRSDDYTPELWTQLAPLQNDIRTDLMRNGAVLSLTFIDRQVEGKQRSYRYLLEFKDARAVERFVLDERDKVSLIQSELGEAKPDTAAADKK